MDIRNDLRNIAIIAHVDHGKTTLVDEMLKQSGIFRENEHIDERVMDSNDLEKERGITIFSKNTAIDYKGIKINIIDTPGHADFGGEVERILRMVDGVLLLVDAFEGPMPQTRFVLKKAMELNLKPIVVINKIDRHDSRAEAVYDEIIDLFINLDANDDQLDFKVIYASSRDGYAMYKQNDEPKNLLPLFETIISEIPKPKGFIDHPLQMLVSNIASDKYIGRMAIGRVERGSITEGQEIAICRKNGAIEKGKVVNLFTFQGLTRKKSEKAQIGDIISVSGIEDINIGESICQLDKPEALDFVDVDEPTISMVFSVNDSPFAGTEGQFVTSRHLRDRLYKELENNVALKVEETDTTDSFKVFGRGELHLSILIETMRREGFEFQVSKPSVVIKDIDGQKYEPVEYLVIDVPENFVGAVMKKLGERKAEMIHMEHGVKGSSRIEFKIPAKNLIGYYGEMLTDTKGNGVMHHTFDGFEPLTGKIVTRSRGSMVAFERGEAVQYGLFYAQKRGELFITAKTRVYQGMVVGQNAKSDDIDVNVCKKKQQTNVRSSGADEALKLVTAKILSLEESLEFIGDDELVEITPQSIRMRKKFLDPIKRKRMSR
ncbi:MAG: translational GTPase TypA [Clostridiales bacterium]|nr:translational GTPase TypA [Clostridiales bacterium]